MMLLKSKGFARGVKAVERLRLNDGKGRRVIRVLYIVVRFENVK